MSVLLILPLVVPLAAAALSLLAWHHPVRQRRICTAAAVLLVVAAGALMAAVERGGIQAVHAGNWPAPFGITVVADGFSALMVLVAAVIGLVVTVYSFTMVDRRREAFGYYPLLQVLLMGVCGAFLTGDLFNLYVWFEVMLIASFVLLGLGGERPQMEGALKYVTLNLLSSALFLAAVGILYGVVGTLNMADLARKLPEMTEPGIRTSVSMLFLVAFGIKAAVFPLFFWLPASYHTPPFPVSAIFAGLLTKVGVYALIRVFTLLFTQDPGYTHRLILVLAALTMVTGVLGAVAQGEFRRVLSFHIISQIGYMLVGLGLFTQLALASSIFYIAHHIIVKTNLFLVSGVAHRFRDTSELEKMGGIFRKAPWLALLFAVPALSLAGFPPFSGFFAKLIVLQAGLQTHEYWVVAVALAVSLLTVFSMCKLWTEAFWKPAPGAGASPGPNPSTRWSLVAPIAVLAVITVTFGVAAEALFGVAWRAAGQLLHPAEYLRAVLGEGV